VVRKGDGWAGHNEGPDVEYFANRPTRIVIDGGDGKQMTGRRGRCVVWVEVGKVGKSRIVMRVVCGMLGTA
jgi:hypothetical protein